MKAIASHTPSFAANPKAQKGDAVIFERFDPENPAWFYGCDPSGTEGYFPVGWFDLCEEDRSAVALRAYDAHELSIAVGASIEPEEEYGDWILANSGGERGWIPRRCIA